MGKIYRYFVEGECEKKLLKSFMYVDGDSFIEGKVDVLNFINKRITKQFARSIKKDTIVVIVIDRDINNTDILEENIKMIEKATLIKREDIYSYVYL